MNECNVFFTAWGFVAGVCAGSVVVILLGIRWILDDPDGQGGWRSRLQQLGMEHKDKKGDNK